MINRRFNKRQRLIKQKVTLRLPRFHRKFLEPELWGRIIVEKLQTGDRLPGVRTS
jgi:hypothetical protein